MTRRGLMAGGTVASLALWTCGGVGMMASLHLQCAASNSGYLENRYDPGFWNPEGFQAGFARPYPIDKKGHVHAPTAPGLGIEWDRGFLRRHKLEAV